MLRIEKKRRITKGLFALVFLLNFDASIWANDSHSNKKENQVIDDGLWVVKETDGGARIDVDGLVIPRAYEERYLGWGTQWSIGVGAFGWLFDEPNIKGDHSEVGLGFRYGFGWGSVELHLGYGLLETKDLGRVDNEKLTLTSIKTFRAGLAYYGENFFFSDYFSPYIEGGACQLSYAVEDSESQKRTISSKAAPYVAVGFNLPLGWLDKESAILSYDEISLSDIALYVEAQKKLLSETEVYLSGGFSLIF